MSPSPFDLQILFVPFNPSAQSSLPHGGTELHAQDLWVMWHCILLTISNHGSFCELRPKNTNMPFLQTADLTQFIPCLCGMMGAQGCFHSGKVLSVVSTTYILFGQYNFLKTYQVSHRSASSHLNVAITTSTFLFKFSSTPLYSYSKGLLS